MLKWHSCRSTRPAVSKLNDGRCHVCVPICVFYMTHHAFNTSTVPFMHSALYPPTRYGNLQVRCIFDDSAENLFISIQMLMSIINRDKGCSSSLRKGKPFHTRPRRGPFISYHGKALVFCQSEAFTSYQEEALSCPAKDSVLIIPFMRASSSFEHSPSANVQLSCRRTVPSHRQCSHRGQRASPFYWLAPS